MASSMPDVTVEIAFNSGYLTPAASRTWTDVTAYVDVERLVSIDRGRPDQFDQPQPSRLSLTLNNRDGRFTPEYTAGAYYPNVKKGRPIRVRSRWVVGGGGTWHDRFVGYVDEWPVEWPGASDAYSTVTVSATSRMARMGLGGELKSIVEEEILYDDPVLYFPLAEPAGALEAGNIAAGRSERLVVTQVGSGGTLEFGAGIGPGTDDLTAPVFTPAGEQNGLMLATSLNSSVTEAGDKCVQLEAWVVWVPGGSTNTRKVIHLGPGPGAFDLLGLNLSLYPLTGQATAYAAATADGAGIVTVLSTSTTVLDGNLHHIVALFTLSGANIVVSIMVDGVKNSSASTAWPLTSGGVGFFPAMPYVSVGGRPAAVFGMFQGTIAHAAIYRQPTTAITDARFVQHYEAGSDGAAGEASGARIARYARLAGIPTAEIGVETGLSTTIAHADTTGQSPIQMMQRVAVTEDGVVFDGKNGTLTFHARDHRYVSTSAFTLSCAIGEVEAGFRPILDDQGMTNDMTASREGGAEGRAVNQSSIDEYGYYRDTVELVTTSDNEVQSRADWQVNKFGTPRVKVTSVSVDVINSSSAQITALLSADIGTRFTLTNLPAQAPASTMDLFIEGISEEIGPESYRMTFNTSAAAVADVFIWDTSEWDETTIWAY